MGINKSKKDKAWKLFSEYIRLRDCIASTASMDRGVCISCHREFPYNKLQAGHLVPGRYNAILFDERIVNAQCYACNMLLGGNGAEYYKEMVRRHGAEQVDEWMLLKHAPTLKFTDEYLDNLIAELQLKINNLKDTYNRKYF